MKASTSSLCSISKEKLYWTRYKNKGRVKGEKGRGRDSRMVGIDVYLWESKGKMMWVKCWGTEKSGEKKDEETVYIIVEFMHIRETS